MKLKMPTFSGLPPESSAPSSLTRHANAQQSSLVNGEIIGKESLVWNPYSTLPPLNISPSAMTTEEPSSDDVAPQSSTVPATEDENYTIDLDLLFMDDLGTTYDDCNLYSDQLPLLIGDSNERLNEIVGGISENDFMENDFFSLFDSLIASGTANTDEIENANFSGLAPESSVPSSPTRHANVQHPSLMKEEIIGKESQVWNPYSTLPALSICPSADDVAPQSSTVPASEDENYAIDLQPLSMDDLGTTYDDCNLYSDQLPSRIGDSNERWNEIVGGVSVNHILDVGVMSYFYYPYFDRLPPHIGQIDERPSELVSGVSENHCRVGQSQQIDYPSGATTDGPSFEAIAPTNSTVLSIENGQSTSICQPTLPFAVGCPPSTSYSPLGHGFCQDDIVLLGAFNGSSTSTWVRELEEYYFMEKMESILNDGGEPHENINFRYQEVDDGKKRRKPNDGRRRCRCKKSKCIQRYCKCFSSGFFCEETCGCKGCDNVIEQETLVLNKRIEIERRNSLAFAPKIVPLHQEEDSKLPGIRLSGRNKRHERGCSCTKSKCLKKYCECYQANVNCSVTCRCKGCGNMDTHEHDSGSTNFMIGEAMMNNNVASNGGEMLPHDEASNNNIGRQARLSSSSSVLHLRQWPPRESTSFGNSVSSYPTFGPGPLPPMNFNEVPANHKGTPFP